MRLLNISQLCLALTLLSSAAYSNIALASNTILGHWETFDDNGQPESLVEIYQSNDTFEGRIVKIYDASRQQAMCEKCSDHRENQPIAGLIFITGLEVDGDEWIDGEVLDPKTGREFNCKVWLDGQQLKLKAGIGFITQTKQWSRPQALGATVSHSVLNP